ncbi:MAG: SPFH domain-containing protein [Phycisphaerales bacterium]
MNADHLSYQRATQVSILGLVIQTVLGAIMLLYGVFGRDPGAMNASYAMLLGVPIWFSLALVFHQHKLERLEAMEAEAYRTSQAADASVFEGIAQDQTVQATRLAWMHKWFLPVMSVLVGAAYIAIAALLWSANREFTMDAEITARPDSGWAISLGVGIAVIAFIFARFVAGMAKQKVWALLNAGSASAVLCSLCGLALALVHFLFTALDASWGLRYLPLAVGVTMFALGAEVILHFLLNFYRPRKPGEWLRPAFDSRVLAFIAAPDRLAASISDAVNYQFGFNVSSTWFYQLIARSVFPLIALVALTVWLLTCFVVIRPDERGLVLKGGALASEVGPGVVFKKPWPFDQVIAYPASSTKELVVGTARPDKDGPILWTNQHSGEETLMLVQPWGAGGEGSATDLALLAVEVPIHFIVSDLSKYRMLAQDGRRDDTEKTRRDLLTAVASGVVMKQLATFPVDALLGDGRAGIAEDLRASVQKAFDTMEAGVTIKFIGVAGVHPKQDVAPSFERVVAADANREMILQRAKKSEINVLARVAGDVEKAREISRELDKLQAMQGEAKADPAAIAAQEQKVTDLIEKAGGQAASILAQAKTQRWQRAIGARAAAVLSEGQSASFRAAPGAYQSLAFIEALRSAANGAKVYVAPPGTLEIHGNFEDIQPDLSGFKPVEAKPEEGG